MGFSQLPDYHDVIEHPMDFGTIRKKLAKGSYSELEQFEVRFYNVFDKYIWSLSTTNSKYGKFYNITKYGLG